MAKHSPYASQVEEAVLPTPQTQVIELSIDGLTHFYDNNGDDRYRLTVKIVDADYGEITRSLTAQGLDAEIVERAVEKLAENIWTETLARDIARRMKRTG